MTAESLLKKGTIFKNKIVIGREYTTGQFVDQLAIVAMFQTLGDLSDTVVENNMHWLEGLTADATIVWLRDMSGEIAPYSEDTLEKVEAKN